MLNRSGGSEYICLNWMYLQFSSVQSFSRVWLFATPWTAAHQASVSITNSWSLLKLMLIESVMPSFHFILCCPLLLPSLFLSIRVFSNESAVRKRGDQNIGASGQYQFFQWIFRTDFLQDWLVWFLCSPRDSQESSLTPQFKSVNYLALSFLYCPTLISIHDDWKNHSFD